MQSVMEAQKKANKAKANRRDLDRIRQEALANAGVGVFLFRADGEILFLDRGTLGLFDLEKKFPEPEKAGGARLQDLVEYEFDRELLLEELQRERRLRNRPYPLRTLSGERRWLLHDFSLVEDTATGKEWVQVVAKDFSTLKKAEDDLDAERERLAVTLRSIAEGVIAIDPERKVVFVNRMAEKLTGWKHSQAVGKPLAEVFRPVDETSRQEVANPAVTALDEGRAVTTGAIKILASRNGSEHLITDQAAPIFDPESKVVGAVLLFRDVEEDRKTEQFRQRAAQLESLEILAGGIAHDFNNFLTGIMGNISLARMMLTNGESINRVLDLLNDAEKSAHSVRGLTNQLLTFARQGTPEKHPTDLSSLISRCSKFVLSGSAIRVELLCDDGLWSLTADHGQLAQVIDNIVINAKQAMADSGNLKITAKNHLLRHDNSYGLARGKYVLIRFEDDGPGIPHRFLKQVFDPYFTTKQKGSGLGLATVYSIVNKHQGRVEIDSEPERGTMVSILWPAAEAGANQGEDADLTAARQLRGKRFLIMDDMDSVGRLTLNMLESLDCQAEYVKRGKTALAACRRALQEGRPFDAVILDLTIAGGEGGVATLKEIRKIWPGVRAVASSGYSNDVVMRDHAAYHFQGAIKKPYSVTDLVSCLSEVFAADGAPSGK